jgi:uncharacterized protein involved in exopolysaccharide biosynthesis
MPDRDHELSCRDWCCLCRKTIQRHFLLLAVSVIGSCLAAFLMTYLLPVKYKAEASLLPRQNSSIAGGMIAQLGPLSSMLSTGGDDLNRLYPDIIKSRRILGEVLKKEFEGRFLFSYLSEEHDGQEESEQYLVTTLQDMVRVRDNIRTGLIEVSCRASEPNLAAFIVNSILAEVDLFVRSNVQDEARRQVAMLEFRLQEVEESLSHAELQLKSFRERNLQTSQSPALSLEEGRLMRAVQIASETYIVLTKQLELAILQTGDSQTGLRVLDPAVAPVRPYWPPRTRIVMLSGLLCGLIGLGAAFWKDHASDSCPH